MVMCVVRFFRCVSGMMTDVEAGFVVPPKARGATGRRKKTGTCSGFICCLIRFIAVFIAVMYLCLCENYLHTSFVISCVIALCLPLLFFAVGGFFWMRVIINLAVL